MAIKSNASLKQPPDEMFIGLARGVYWGSSPSPSDDEIGAVHARWREVVRQLRDAGQGQGKEGFWRVWDSLSVDRPLMQQWRPLIEVAPDEEGEKADPRFVQQDGATLLKLYSIEDIYALPDAQHLIANILEASGVSLLYGVSGTGKTFTALNLGLSIAHGISWHDRDVAQGHVWYINTEGGHGLKKRLRAWYVEHPDLKPSPYFHVVPWALNLREHHQILTESIKRLNAPPALIIIDNFSLCAPGVNQNHQEEVAPVLAVAHEIAQVHNCHLMILHHTNKEDDVNGSMAFRNHVDTMIELKKESKTEKDSPILFCCKKSRDDEPFDDIRTLLKRVTVAVEEDTARPITSCVIVDCDQPEPEPVTPDEQMKLLGILDAHGRLTCGQWQRLSQEVHQISRATFYRLRSVLVQEDCIIALDAKNNGKSLSYALSEKGSQLVSPVSNQSHETGKLVKKPVSPVSHPFRGETGETGFETREGESDSNG